MKVRVKKEMPFAKVGDEFESNSFGDINISSTRCFKLQTWADGTEELIRDGWLEPIPEEKTLSEEFRNRPFKLDGNKVVGICDEFARIAHDKALEIFDKALPTHIEVFTASDFTRHIRNIRQTLDDGMR